MRDIYLEAPFSNSNMNCDNIFTIIYLCRVIQYYQVNVLELMLNLQEMQVSLLIETPSKK